MRALGIRGAGITMPHKIKVIDYVDCVSEEVQEIGAANTLVNDAGVITCYNTDAFSSYQVLKRYEDRNEVHILGNGGYSQAVQYSAKKIFPIVRVITRDKWDQIPYIKDSVIFNCTPVRNITLDKSSIFIDCSTETTSGQELALLQASKQFEIYTGVEFPLQYIKDNFTQILMETAS